MKDKFFHKKILTPFLSLLLAIACIGTTTAICLWPDSEEKSLQQLYEEAVMDAVTIEPGEVKPLVTITPKSDMVTWKDGKVLLMTLNHHPERYIEGEIITLPDEVWTVADKELSSWINSHKKDVKDWTLRLKQLVGVKPEDSYTHMTAMWVSPKDVRRPAYNTDITEDSMPTTLPKDTPEEYKEWFHGNIIWSYFDSSYPWTRLGYTYDWAEDSDEYGLTEFWIRPNAQVEIAYTDTVDDFIARLE